MGGFGTLQFPGPTALGRKLASVGLIWLLAAAFALGAWDAPASGAEGGAKMIGGISKVERATVFLSGAEVTRSMQVVLAPGKNIVTFGNLPLDVTPESIVAGISDNTGGTELMSAVYHVNHLEKPEGAARIERLNAEYRIVQDDIARNADKRAVCDAEEEFLKKNSSIGGKTGIQLEDLRAVSDYYRTRLAEIASEKFRLKKEAEELQRTHDSLASVLGSAVDYGRKAVGEITVELSAAQAGNETVSVSYFVQSAGWTPFYEIRVADLDGPARLIGKGRIYQTTGEDWNELPVVLSSGTPAIGGTQPELMPWYLDFNAPLPESRYQSFNRHRNAAPMQEMAMDSEALEMSVMMERDSEDREKRAMLEEFARTKRALVAQQGQTSVEFILPAPISVPSKGAGDPYTVEIMSAEMPAVYEHYSVRKLDRDVYLLAKIEGWEKLNILEGEAAIFLGNTFVGTSHIDPRRADDTMELSLGRDRGVIVTRVKGRDFAGKSLFGQSNKVTREWVLTVRNTRSTPIDIRILDQLPVSVNKEIKVEALELSGAEHDTEKGELRWTLRLDPGESAQKSVKYTVTYPKGRKISLE